MSNLQKFGATMKISEEVLFGIRSYQDPRYERRATIYKVPPTPEAWELYRAAVVGLAALEAYDGTMFGGPDYGTEVPEPEPTTTVYFLETVDEWLDRCRALEREAREQKEETE